MTYDQEIVLNVIEIVKKSTKSNEINTKSSMLNTENWDSLAYMSIVSELELNYAIEVTQENIQNFDSVESILSLLEANKPK
jgi:acyl carrier protein